MVDTTSTKKSGRKRAIITGGVLLGAGALITAAAFTDFALLDINGEGGFGGSENAYNITVSTGQEPKVAEVTNWVEANPDAESVAPIDGADSLFPGGDPLYVNLPVMNASQTMKSTLDITLELTTAVDADPAQQLKNEAYAGLMRFQVAQVDDATGVPGSWVTVSDLSFGPNGKTATVNLADLDASAGSIVVLRVALDEGANQGETNAANGGTAAVQARFDGASTK